MTDGPSPPPSPGKPPPKLSGAALGKVLHAGPAGPAGGPRAQGEHARRGGQSDRPADLRVLDGPGDGEPAPSATAHAGAARLAAPRDPGRRPRRGPVPAPVRAPRRALVPGDPAGLARREDGDLGLGRGVPPAPSWSPAPAWSCRPTTTSASTRPSASRSSPRGSTAPFAPCSASSPATA